jgi:hypothetical protein
MGIERKLWESPTNNEDETNLIVHALASGRIPEQLRTSNIGCVWLEIYGDRATSQED